MKTLILLMTLAVIIAVGFLMMDQIDRFLSGGIHPYWDEEE